MMILFVGGFVVYVVGVVRIVIFLRILIDVRENFKLFVD